MRNKPRENLYETTCKQNQDKDAPMYVETRRNAEQNNDNECEDNTGSVQTKSTNETERKKRWRLSLSFKSRSHVDKSKVSESTKDPVFPKPEEGLAKQEEQTECQDERAAELQLQCGEKKGTLDPWSIADEPQREQRKRLSKRKLLETILDKLETQETKCQKERILREQKEYALQETLKKEFGRLNQQQTRCQEELVSHLEKLEKVFCETIDQAFTKLEPQQTKCQEELISRLEKTLRETLDQAFAKLEQQQTKYQGESSNSEKKVDKSKDTSKKTQKEIQTLNNTIKDLDSKLYKILETKNKNKNQAKNTLTAIYSVYLEMEQCENLDQTKYQTYRLKKLLEEYEELTGEKLAWRL